MKNEAKNALDYNHVVTDDDIIALCAEAGAAGDPDMAALCESAMSGDEDARAEVMAALEAVKRREATREFRKALRGQEGRYIEVFADMIPE